MATERNAAWRVHDHLILLHRIRRWVEDTRDQRFPGPSAREVGMLDPRSLSSNCTCLSLCSRLGRISFRQIKNKRDYLLHRKNASWMYMSRLAAIREFTYMKALYDHGFPVPVPYDQSRHTILMSYVDAYPFGQVREISHTGRVYSELLNLIVRLAEHGLIHADFNEFNLLIDQQEKITLIDFPQMVSTSHPEAEEFFQRDVGCITRYFTKRFGYLAGDFPRFHRDIDESKRIDLDKELAASGHAFASADQQKEFESYIVGKTDAATIAAYEALEGAEDDDEAGEDEEALAASLGVEAEDLDGEQLGEEEAERLREQLEGELRDEEQAGKKATKTAAPAKAKKAVQAAPQEEDDDEEYDSAAEEEARQARMARKDARQKSLAHAQALKAARKAQEKERKKLEREGGAPIPPAAAAVEASASSSAEPAAAAAAAADDANDGEYVSGDDDADSIASSAASMALSQLGLRSKNLLNIQLPKPQQRLKRTNRNKDREMKKVKNVIKEHL